MLKLTVILLGLLSFVNLAGLFYLSYLILKKYRQLPPNSLSLPPSNSLCQVHLTRYNPFDDLGSDQSFILCLLDSTNSGVIITSLHHRNFTRIYAKPIKNGQGDKIALSKEEKSAILKTINR